MLIPVVVGAILFGSSHLVGVVLALFVVLGAWEWAGLMGWRNAWRVAFVSITVLLVVDTLVRGASHWYPWLLIISLGWWLVALAWLHAAQRSGQPGRWFQAELLKLLIGLVILFPAWLALFVLHRAADGPALLLTLFCVIWGADSGAYMAGRRWGRHKLASNISPGKTWEGVAGGLLAAVLISLAAAWLMGFATRDAIGFVILCAATVPVSVAGDLTESLFKRQAGVKDSGRLLPGHGGALDRVDSLCAAAPFFVVGLQLLGGVA